MFSARHDLVDRVTDLVPTRVPQGGAVSPRGSSWSVRQPVLSDLGLHVGGRRRLRDVVAQRQVGVHLRVRPDQFVDARQPTRPQDLIWHASG